MSHTARILQTLGLDALSPMQQTFIDASSKGRDVILLSSTGSGKTLAYLLAALPHVDAERRCAGPQMVVTLPSRELAMQSDELLKRMKTPLRSVCLIGGHATTEESRLMAETHPHIVFATPGRLNDHLRRGSLDARDVRLFVIDEYDKCLDMGFADEMAEIRRHLADGVNTWLISATSDVVRVADFVDEGKAVRVDYAENTDETARISCHLVASPEKDKLETLGRLLSILKGAPAIVFVAHRESADRVAAYLKSARFYAEKYHGGMEQRDRERALYKFRSGGSNVMVATDLAARGLDIVEVRAVVHYHLPQDEVTFEHRNGRSTRWERSGDAYIILGPEEQLPPFVEAAECHKVAGLENTTLSPALPEWSTVYIGRGKKEKLSRGDIAGFFCKKGGLKASDIGRIDVGEHHAFAAIRRNRLKAALQAVAGEKIKGMKTIVEEMR